MKCVGVVDRCTGSFSKQHPFVGAQAVGSRGDDLEQIDPERWHIGWRAAFQYRRSADRRCRYGFTSPLVRIETPSADDTLSGMSVPLECSQAVASEFRPFARRSAERG